MKNFFALTSLFFVLNAGTAQTVNWALQQDFDFYDTPKSVGTDGSGNVYVSGTVVPYS